MAKKLNFAGLTGDYADLEQSKIVILPVPFDKTSTGYKGSDKGPKSIIEASRIMELYDIETKTHVFEENIHTAPEIKAKTPSELVRSVEEKVSELSSSGKFVVILGGEHTVSVGAIRAHAKKEKITVVQLDAHSDMREDFEGEPLSHACVMARAKEVAPVIQIGIRSLDSSELENIVEENTFFAKDIWKSEAWIEKAVSKAGPKVYVTMDLDVFDTGIMPSTGTPEPGGLQWYPVLKFLKKLSEEREIVGFDVVELCPNPNNKAPDYLAAKLVYTFLSYIFANRKK